MLNKTNKGAPTGGGGAAEGPLDDDCDKVEAEELGVAECRKP